MDIGVDVVHHLPGVGANLQDHYVARVSHRVRNAKSINRLSRGTNLLKEIGAWVFAGKGALTFVFPVVTVGISEASTTRNPFIP